MAPDYDLLRRSAINATTPASKAMALTPLAASISGAAGTAHAELVASKPNTAKTLRILVFIMQFSLSV